MPAPMKPAPSTPMRSSGRASAASFLARPSTAFLVKKIEIRFLATPVTTISEKALASSSRPSASDRVRPSRTTSMALSGAG